VPSSPSAVKKWMCRKPEVIGELERVLSRVGWKFSGTTLIPIEIFDVAELADIPEAAQADIQKADSRLRDGDLGGALSAACGALDAVTSDIYSRHGLGDAGKASFQERIRRSLDALQVKNHLIGELTNLGWAKSDYKPLSAKSVRASGLAGTVAAFADR